jgi:hypothetical protein
MKITTFGLIKKGVTIMGDNIFHFSVRVFCNWLRYVDHYTKCTITSILECGSINSSHKTLANIALITPELKDDPFGFYQAIANANLSTDETTKMATNTVLDIIDTMFEDWLFEQ